MGQQFNYKWNYIMNYRCNYMQVFFLNIITICALYQIIYLNVST